MVKYDKDEFNLKNFTIYITQDSADRLCCISALPIPYQYEANGNVYTGEIVKSNAPKKLGETLEIKYAPDAPENSTEYFKPSPGFLVSGIVVLLVSGLFAFHII